MSPSTPHLTTLLVHGELIGAMLARLANYRRDRDQAAMEIEQKLGQLQDLSFQDVATIWQEFVSKENSTWAKIEKEKLSILNKLQHGGIWTRGVGIDEFPFLWRHFSASPIYDDGIKLRALRHFAPHLSLDQRDLIGEILAEVATSDSNDSENRYWKISLDGKHLDLPTDPNPATVRALSAYKETKKQLKKDLLQTLVSSVWIPGNNREFVAKMKKLRRNQTPQFERLAQQLKVVAATLEESESELSQDCSESPPMMAASPAFNPATLTLLASPERRLLASANVRY
tara:strand:- start:957 stop:1814 length:858 start_codon:yes stop_codon:yes gene_type:complete